MSREWIFISYCILLFLAYVNFIFAMDRIRKQKKRRKK